AYATHDPHVLLRHRLLLQPHSFEGVGVIEKHLNGDDAAIEKRPHFAVFEVHLRAVAGAAEADPHGNAIPDVDEITDPFRHDTGQMFAVSCRQRMTASRPRKGPSTNPSAGRSVTSGCVISHSVGQSSAAYAAIARRKTLTFCSEIRGHLPANCAFSS